MLNLERLRSDVIAHLEQRGLVVFKGLPRQSDMPCDDIFWDRENHPDFRDFLATAEAAGVRMVTVAAVTFHAEVLEGALEHLSSSSLDPGTRRSFKAQLREMGRYDGSLCELELSFFHAGRTYAFHESTDWFEELTELLEEIEASSAEVVDPNPLGGFYSNN